MDKETYNENLRISLYEKAKKSQYMMAEDLVTFLGLTFPKYVMNVDVVLISRSPVNSTATLQKKRTRYLLLQTGTNWSMAVMLEENQEKRAEVINLMEGGDAGIGPLSEQPKASQKIIDKLVHDHFKLGLHHLRHAVEHNGEPNSILEIVSNSENTYHILLNGKKFGG